MRNIIVLSLDELQQLKQGKVVEFECNSIKTQIVCADTTVEALTLIEMQKRENNNVSISKH